MTEVVLQGPDRFQCRNRVLFNLSLSLNMEGRAFADNIQSILEASTYIAADRISIWLFNKKNDRLERLALRQNGTTTLPADFTLYRNKHSRYFSSFESSRYLAIKDTSTGTTLSELRECYLVPESVESKLDVQILPGSANGGILSFEQCEDKHEWSEDDIQFALSVSDLLAIELTRQSNRESLEIIESGFDIIAQGILVCDEQGRITKTNKRTEDCFGYPHEVLVNKTISELLPGCMDRETGRAAHTHEGIQSPHAVFDDLEGVRSNGETFPVEYSLTRLQDAGKPYLLFIFSDITERRERDGLITSNELLYRSVVEDQTDLIIRVAPGGTGRFANSLACEYLNINPEQFTLLNVFDLVPKEEHPIIYQAVQTLSVLNPVATYSHHVFLPNDEQAKICWVLRAFFNEKGEIAGYQGIGRDVTIEETREHRERESQKMESLAVLAGGMAHDFNNLLTPIMSYTDLTQVCLDQESEEYKNLQYVMEAATRARELTKMVLIFSKQEDRRDRHPVFASRFIREILTFVRSTSPSRIIFTENVDTDCGVISANPSDLYQIISNLCTNAVHAMPAGGELNINCTRLTRYNQHQLQIEIRDTGSGIPREKLGLIFDPFYTTKPSGQGTGLGLSVVKSIIEELGGSILCSSEQGKGSSFVIHLPLLNVLPEEEAAKDQNQSSMSGNETILVVDDELHVASSIRSVLENLGYTIIMRTSPNDALSTFLADPHRFDAIITDYTMPYMSGVELAWKFKHERNDIPIIMMSGYGKLLTQKEVQSAGLSAIIDKPFLVEEVASLLRETLNNAAQQENTAQAALQ